MTTNDPFLIRLIELSPPPPNPSFAGSPADFEIVEKSHDLTFPTGYKELIQLYGYGVWFNLFCVLNPFVGDGGKIDSWYCPRYGMTGGRQLCEGLRAAREDFPTFYPFPIYPEAGGLFPWAFTDQGGEIYWFTDGSPDEWKSIHLIDGDEEIIEKSIPAILVGLATGDRELTTGAWKSWFVHGHPKIFTPKNPPMTGSKMSF